MSFVGAFARLDQVVAVHRRRHRDARDVRLRELEQRHLRGRVLHRHAVGAKLQVALSGAQVGRRRVVEVPDEDLLRQRQRASRAVLRTIAMRSAISRVDLGDELRVSFRWRAWSELLQKNNARHFTMKGRAFREAGDPSGKASSLVLRSARRAECRRRGRRRC